MLRKLPVLKPKYKTLPVPESKVMSLFNLTLFCGPTKSGKSFLAISMAKMLRQEGNCTKIFLFCPTFEAQPLYSAVLEPQDKVYTDINRCFETLVEIENEMIADAAVYADQLKAHLAYQKYVNGDAITPADEAILDQNQWQDVKPIRPCPLIMLDDLQGSQMMSLSKRNPLTSLNLRHRHLAEGLGCNIWFLTQSHKACPKAVRNSFKYICAFRTANIKEKQSFYDESSQQLTFDEFNRRFEEYTARKHGYMWIDNERMTVGPSF